MTAPLSKVPRGEGTLFNALEPRARLTRPTIDNWYQTIPEGMAEGYRLK